MYCQAYADYRDAIDEIDEDGAIITTEVSDRLSQSHKNPYIDIRDSSIRTMTAIGKKLGLSPDAPIFDWNEYSPMAEDYEDDQEETGEAGEAQED